MIASILHINGVPQPAFTLLLVFLDYPLHMSSPSVKQGQQVSPLSRFCGHPRVCLLQKGKSCSLTGVSRTRAVCLHTMHVRCPVSVCCRRQRDVRMCEEGEVRRGHTKGAWDPGWRDRGRDRIKRGRTKDGSVDGKM